MATAVLAFPGADPLARWPGRNTLQDDRLRCAYTNNATNWSDTNDTLPTLADTLQIFHALQQSLRLLSACQSAAQIAFGFPATYPPQQNEEEVLHDPHDFTNTHKYARPTTTLYDPSSTTFQQSADIITGPSASRPAAQPSKPSPFGAFDPSATYRQHGKKAAKAAQKAAQKNKWADEDEGDGAQNPDEGGGDGGGPPADGAGGAGGGDDDKGGDKAGEEAGDSEWGMPMSAKQRKKLAKQKKTAFDWNTLGDEGDGADAGTGDIAAVDAGGGEPNPDDEWGGFETAGKKKKGKAKKGEDIAASTPPPAAKLEAKDDKGFDEIDLGNKDAPKLDLDFGGGTEKKSSGFGFSGWGSGWGGASNKWDFSGADEKAEEKKDDTWGSFGSKKDSAKTKKTGFDFGFGSDDKIDGVKKETDDPWAKLVGGSGKTKTTGKGKVEEISVEPTVEMATETATTEPADDPWGGWASTTKKSKKKQAAKTPDPEVVKDESPPPPPPPPAPADDDPWAEFSTKKGKQKKRAGKEPTPEPESKPVEPPPAPEPPVDTPAEPEAADDSWTWGLSAKEQKKLKKQKKLAGKEDIPATPAADPEPVPEPVPEPPVDTPAEPEAADDSWTWGLSAKEQKKLKKQKKSAGKEDISATPVADPEPVPEPVPEPPQAEPIEAEAEVDDFSWMSAKDRKKALKKQEKERADKERAEKEAAEAEAAATLAAEEAAAAEAAEAAEAEAAAAAAKATEKSSSKVKSSSKKSSKKDPTPEPEAAPDPEPSQDLVVADKGDEWWADTGSSKKKKSKSKAVEEIPPAPSPPPAVEDSNENDWSFSWGQSKKEKVKSSSKSKSTKEASPPPAPEVEEPKADADDDWGAGWGIGTKSKKSSKSRGVVEVVDVAPDVPVVKPDSPPPQEDDVWGSWSTGKKSKTKSSSKSKGRDEEKLIEAPPPPPPEPEPVPEPVPEPPAAEDEWAGLSKKERKKLEKEKAKAEKDRADEEAAAAAAAAEAEAAAAAAEAARLEEEKLAAEAAAQAEADAKAARKAAKADKKSGKSKGTPEKTVDEAAFADALGDDMDLLPVEESPSKSKTSGKSKDKDRKSSKSKDDGSEKGSKTSPDATVDSSSTFLHNTDMPKADKSSKVKTGAKESVADRIKAFQTESKEKERDAKLDKKSKRRGADEEVAPPPPPPVESPIEDDSKRSKRDKKSSSKSKDDSPPPSSKHKTSSPLPGGFPEADLLDSFEPVDRKKKSSKSKRATEDLIDLAEPPLPTPPPEDKLKSKRDKHSSSKGKSREPSPPEKSPKKDDGKRSKSSRDKTSSADEKPEKAKKRSDEKAKKADEAERKAKDDDPKRKSDRKSSKRDEEKASSESDRGAKLEKERPKPSRGSSFGGLFGSSGSTPSKSKSTRDPPRSSSKRHSIAVDSPLSPPDDIDPKTITGKAAGLLGLGRRDSKMDKRKSRAAPDPYAIDDDIVMVDPPEASPDKKDRKGKDKEKSSSSKKKRDSHYMAGGLGDSPVIVDAPSPPDDLAFDIDKRPTLKRANTSAKKGLLGGLFGSKAKDAVVDKGYVSDDAARRKRGATSGDDGAKRLRREERKVGRDKGSDADVDDEKRRAERRARRAEREAAEAAESAKKDEERRERHKARREAQRKDEEDREAARHEERRKRRAEKEGRHAAEAKDVEDKEARRKRREEKDRPKTERRKTEEDDGERRLRRSAGVKDLGGEVKSKDRRKSEYVSPSPRDEDPFYYEREPKRRSVAGPSSRDRYGERERRDEGRYSRGKGRDHDPEEERFEDAREEPGQPYLNPGPAGNKTTSWVHSLASSDPDPPPLAATILESPPAMDPDLDERARRRKQKLMEYESDEEYEKRRRRRDERRARERAREEGSRDDEGSGRRDGPAHKSMGYGDMGRTWDGQAVRPPTGGRKSSWFQKLGLKLPPSSQNQITIPSLLRPILLLLLVTISLLTLLQLARRSETGTRFFRTTNYRDFSDAKLDKMPLVVPGLQGGDGDQLSQWASKLMGKKIGDSHDETTFAKTDLPQKHRVLKPGDGMTMDFVPDRLNVHVDEGGVVKDVKHG
ncbi:hypothetical protein CAC42_7798 [Sphaceloma murrayae]|uniref:Uncharacterized protein n=1 Tax=Sphaceloma murrayae TaxID=2082308 RepID=A0A2K1QXQ9_9PEZI|nr:hypothetical protein CAC42_7798 [Sphaceloma murrayae]